MKLTQDQKDIIQAAVVHTLLHENVAIDEYDFINWRARKPYFGLGKPGDIVFAVNLKHRYSKIHNIRVFTGYYGRRWDRIHNGKLIIHT